MDIIDIILASKKSTVGEVDTLVKQAQAAMASANEVTAILEDAQEANAAAQEAKTQAIAANTAAQQSAAQYEAMVSNLEETTAAAVREQIAEVTDSLAAIDEAVLDSIEDDINTDLSLSKSSTTRNNAVETDLTLNLMDGESKTLQGVVKNYKTVGNNEDGSMTQKAIKDYVEDQISNVDITDKKFGIDKAGNIVVIDENGNIAAGTTSEADIIAALINSGSYNVDGTVGLQLDYANKTFTRIQDAEGLVEGTAFNKYSMYGGRMRCNVADDGTITAFYGDSNYREDGSNGQVMVYQPKFYYQRTPITMNRLTYGNAVKKETIILSSQKQAGFKLHPLFINENGEIVDYVLLPAYQGSIYDNSTSTYNTTSDLTVDFANDKLSSIAAAKPIAGSTTNPLTVEKAEQLARNRGTGWHITNMAAESANQMLSMVEFGQPNLQSALEAGIVNITGVAGTNCSSITGSTSTLGNTTGVADSTRNEINGTYTSYNNAGKRAIAYRGIENPWGNLWHFIGGVNIYSASGRDGGGYPYICKNFNYQYDSVTNYENVGFQLPANHSWISAMGYSNEDYDWVYMPAECSSANSALPVGDSLWSNPILNGINCAVIGGTWESDTEAGPFYYGCDREINYYKYSFGANLMFIPAKNDTYTANINKWNSKMG